MKHYTVDVLGKHFTENDNHPLFLVSDDASPDDVLMQASNLLAGVLEYETQEACESNLHNLIIHTLEAVKALIDSVDIREVKHD